MKGRLDPQLEAGLAAIVPLSIADLASARAALDEEAVANRVAADTTGLTVVDTSAGDVPVRVFTPVGQGPFAALLSIHGGGYVTGSMSLDEEINASLAREAQIVVVAVDYRLAPEHPYPAGLDDCRTALAWLRYHADQLHVDAQRIGVFGDSAGGGLAAALALSDRDAGGTLAAQLLLEPMLDARCATASMRDGADAVLWTSTNSIDAWALYLGEQDADQYASAAYAEHLDGLPATYLTVNECDPLRDEGLEYAQRLLHAGVSVELHCWPGAFHAFAVVPGTDVARRERAALLGAVDRLLGRGGNVPT